MVSQQSDYNLLINEQNEFYNEYINKSIEDDANFFNKMLVIYTNKIIEFGQKNEFDETNLFDCRKNDKFSFTSEKFYQILEQIENKTGKIQIGTALWILNRNKIFQIIILVTISQCLQFTGPIVIQKVIEYIDQPQKFHKYFGFTIVLIQFFNNILRSILFIRGNSKLNQVQMSYQICLQAIVFKKILTLSKSSRNYLETGKIINLSSIDVLQIQSFFVNGGWYIVIAPIMVTISMILIYIEIGEVGLIGILIIAICSIISGFFVGKQNNIRKKELLFADKRSRYLTEFISGIRLIKYFGWEDMILQKIMKIRNQETKYIYLETICRSINEFITNIIPIAISITVFGFYVAQGNQLTVPKAFVVLNLFSLLQTPIRLFANAISMLINVKVSFKRINQFIQWHDKPDISDYNIVQQNYGHVAKGEIIIQNGCFQWELEEIKAKYSQFQDLMKNKSKIVQKVQENREVLIDINMKIDHKEFIVLVGQVGSGKTSLINAILGEIPRSKGIVFYQGTVAYVSQNPWLQNNTLRNNITFGQEFDPIKYNQIIQLCDLIQDIQMLPGGDLTEIGEKGINLSGGQKQRVSIARALYSNSDIYLFDDCLSALDANVGQIVFENVFLKYLKDKTRIFATHNMNFSKKCDRVCVLKEGKLVEYDQVKQLILNKNSEYNRLLLNNQNDCADKYSDLKQQSFQLNHIPFKQQHSQVSQNLLTSVVENSDQKQLRGKLIQKEQLQKGEIEFQTYYIFLKHGGVCYGCFSILLILVARLASSGNNLWLGAWSDDMFNFSVDKYLWIYCLIGLGTGLLILLASFSFNLFARTVSYSLQKQMLISIFRSPMSWFDTVPSGRILNRCAKDQDDVDMSIPWQMKWCLDNFLQVISLFVITISIMPAFFLILVLFLPLFMYVLKKYQKSSRELKRVESISRSPIYAHISEVASGYAEIRNYQKQDMVYQDLMFKYDKFIKASINGFYVNRWVQIRMDLIAAFCMSGALLITIIPNQLNLTSNLALLSVALSSVTSAFRQFIKGLIKFIL